MKIAFIGLGTMGLPMALCLRDRGFEVLGLDSDARAMRRFGGAAGSIAELAVACDRVVTMLPEGAQVESVHGQLLASGLRADCLLIDCSTIDVATTRRLAGRAAAAGHDFVDAPVSGGREAAAKGSLSFMIGGSAAGIERARPLLEAMGDKLTEFGAAGAGQAAKVCHNLICGVTALGVCEAFALADALGLDAVRFFDLCRSAAAQSWILENRCPVPGPAPAAPASNDYRPGFAARLMAKDLGLAQQAAADSGQPAEFAAAAARRFREFVEAGGGDLDFSAIYRSIRK